jgi:hypothetical protein
MTASAFGPITPCPSCGTLSSENYDGAGQCWTCYVREHPSVAVQPERERIPAWLAFRFAIRDAMRAAGGCNYVDRDTVSGRCPICGDVVGVTFVGREQGCEFHCLRGCDPAAIAAAFGKAVAL